MTSQAEYAFDNNDSEAANQLKLISETVDPHSIATLETIGVAPGWKCWDVGAGAGTIARWLATRVGPGGRVFATDLKPQHISADDNLSVMRHDVRTDTYPSDGFDLVHARLLLMHLPGREAILRRLANSLKPGGLLVVSDWETSYLDLVLDSPDTASAEVFRRFLDICLAGSPPVGIDPQWASRTNAAMRNAGLTDVTTTTHAKSWPGGTGACLLHRSNTIQLHSRLLKDGFAETELRTLREALIDPRFVISSYLMFTTIGTKN